MFEYVRKYGSSVRVKATTVKRVSEVPGLVVRSLRGRESESAHLLGASYTRVAHGGSIFHSSGGTEGPPV